MKLEKFQDILIEKYIPGREIQAAILGKKTLGIIELKPNRKFYDYKAKYSADAKTEHIIPVSMSTRNFKKISIPKLPVFTTEDGIRTIKKYFGKIRIY